MKNRLLTILLTACVLGAPLSAAAQDPAPPAQTAPQPTAPPNVASTPSPAKARAIERLKQPEAPRPSGGYGGMLLQMLVALAVVCALAFVILKWGLKRLVAGGSAGARMQVLERLPIEPRRSVVVVRVGARTLVLGSSEAGVELLTELHGSEASEFISASQPASFKETAKRAHQSRADAPLTSGTSDT